jgi:hypothetical protein
MEPKVEEDELRDILDHFIVETKRPEALSRHLRADHFVVMEGDAATGNQFPGPWFPDVMKECS